MSEKAPTTTEERPDTSGGPVVTGPDEHGNIHVIHRPNTYTDGNGNVFLGSDARDGGSPTSAEAQRQIDAHRVRRAAGGLAIKSEVV